MKIRDFFSKNTHKALRTAGREGKKLLSGSTISSKFFIEHFFPTAFFVMICVGAIALRFECAENDNEIASLNKQIHEMNTAKQKERSRYMTLTRESAMIHLVDSLHLGLSIPERRPRIITLDTD